jgi:amidase
MPFDCWENLKVTRKLFFQTGFEEGKKILAAAGEEMKPGVQFTLKTFKTQPLSITELFACNTQMSMWKGQMSEWWSSTASKTSTGRPLDALICPVSAAVGAPHDMPGYCGYTSVFNILDYPAATLPLKDFKVSAEKDPKDLEYQPVQTNPYDSMVHEMCKTHPAHTPIFGPSC